MSSLHNYFKMIAFIFLVSLVSFNVMADEESECTGTYDIWNSASQTCEYDYEAKCNDDGGTWNQNTLECETQENTTTINWYNGDEIVTTTTCSVDDGIQLPSTPPTRVGYTFAGWKIKEETQGE